MVVLPLKRPDIFNGLRGPPKGLLLFGPPGTGKTLIGETSLVLDLRIIMSSVSRQVHSKSVWVNIFLNIGLFIDLKVGGGGGEDGEGVVCRGHSPRTKCDLH